MKVSVLMLTYNQEVYIDEAIRSVMLQQCDFAYELVIGEDCSTDDTLAHCKAWQQKHPGQIRIVKQAVNIGLARNFVESYKALRGQYVAICEGDDWWCSPYKLQRQVDWMEAHPSYSCCFHRVINYYQDTNIKSLSNGGQKSEMTILDLAASNTISNVSALFRRELFGEMPQWMQEVSTYDYAIHLMNAEYGPIHYMKTPMAVYRQHSNAIWSRTGQDKKWDISITIRRLLIAYFNGRKDEFSQSNEVCELLQKSIDHIEFNRARMKELPEGYIVPVPFLSRCRAWVSRFIPVPRIRS